MAKRVKKASATRRQSFVQRSTELTLSSEPALKGRIPDDILDSYEVKQWKHAAAILATDFPSELADIVNVLRNTKVHKRNITDAGGGKSGLSKDLGKRFADLGWKPKRWKTEIRVDEDTRESPTHEVDCVSGRVAVELEWSNKDPFFDRDLNNFRLLFDLRVISVGVIITKSDDYAAVFHALGKWKKYGTTTTWMHKLLPRIEGGGGGGCPILVFGLTKKLYVED